MRISDFKIAKAKDIRKHMNQIRHGDWFISRKIDGVRVLAIIDGDGVCKCFSSCGHHFPALEPLEIEIEKINVKNMVLDGEISIMSKNGSDKFNETVGQVRRKSKKMENYHYYVFDILTLSEFQQRTSDTIFSERQKRFKKFSKLKNVSLVKQMKMTDHTIVEMKKKAQNLKWEGLMLRKDDKYKGNRSSDILKIKKFKDKEFIIIGFSKSSMKILDHITGKIKTVPILKNIQIKFKGNIVHVGSGFTQAQRIYYSKNPKQLLGKKVTVKYFEESRNRNDGKSLRFPVVKKIWFEPKI